MLINMVERGHLAHSVLQLGIPRLEILLPYRKCSLKGLFRIQGLLHQIVQAGDRQQSFCKIVLLAAVALAGFNYGLQSANCCSLVPLLKGFQGSTYLTVTRVGTLLHNHYPPKFPFRHPRLPGGWVFSCFLVCTGKDRRYGPYYWFFGLTPS